MSTGSVSRIKAIMETLTCVAFFGALFAGGLTYVAIAAAGKAAPPDKTAMKVSLSTLGQVPEQFRSYFNEAFPLRKSLVRMHGLLWVKGLRSSSSSQVVLGAQDRLFFSGDQAMLDYRNVKPFKDADLATWSATLERRRRWLEARGSRYLFVVVPNSQSIYPELVPARLNRVRAESRLDQLIGHLQRTTKVQVLDLRPALRRARDESGDVVYHRTDTHWNQLGAYTGYQELARTLGGITPMSPGEFNRSHSRRPGGDLARLLGLQEVIQEDVVELKWQTPPQAKLVNQAEELKDRDVKYQRQVMSECPTGEIPRLVMFRDSQASALIPYLSEHFGRAVYVWTDGWDFDCELVERERPNIVIEEIVERKLMREAPVGTPRENELAARR